MAPPKEYAWLRRRNTHRSAERIEEHSPREELTDRANIDLHRPPRGDYKPHRTEGLPTEAALRGAIDRRAYGHHLNLYLQRHDVSLEHCNL